MTTQRLAIIAATLTLGGLVTPQIAGVRLQVRRLADRLGMLKPLNAWIERIIETLQTSFLRRQEGGSEKVTA